MSALLRIKNGESDSHMTGKPVRMPEKIAGILGDAFGQTDGLGKSGAEVILYDDYVLKVRPAGGWDTMDTQVLRWLAGKLPVPEVAAHEVQDGLDWLLMTRIKGQMLCDPQVMGKPALLMDCMAEALHMLWSVPVKDCPFTRPVKDHLDHAEKAIRAGMSPPKKPGARQTFGTR